MAAEPRAPEQEAELLRRIEQRHWFHTIDLGAGRSTRGEPPSEVLSARGARPDVTGRSVLDIGAWDGKYSFEAERAGAARVVALDHYVWRLDGEKRQAYYDACQAEGRLPDPAMIDTGFLATDGFPGRAGFDLIREYLQSDVEPVVDDFMTMDLDALGTFDVVFYFGVLYHMVNPIEALRRLRRVTGEVAVVETLAVVIPDHAEDSLVEFYAADEVGADYGNWFAPSERALHGMCRASGFRRVETRSITQGNKPRFGRLRRSGRSVRRCRLVVHAYP
jgi:tRNA (mo5U34)-methyltransferase